MSPVLSRTQRRNIIRNKIVLHTYDELARLCGVTKRTIRRDVEAWKKEGGYDEFLTEQFFKLYGIIKTQDVKHAFDKICDLMRRRQDQIRTTIVEGGAKPIIVKLWKPQDESTS